MSADFWAGYISGAVGILIGNPLDLIKVRLQSSSHTSITATHPSTYASQFTSTSSLIRGATAPILGYGALNALLFMTYNRTTAFLTPGYSLEVPGASPSLYTVFIAGAVGGLASWVVSSPTELIKCRAQISNSPISSFSLARSVIRAEGVKGLYYGGTVTALRDSIGYGFYFWSYELGKRILASKLGEDDSPRAEAAKSLLCGGIAGVVTWASVFPLDVIKTRVQTQTLITAETAPLLSAARVAVIKKGRIGAVEMARRIYRDEGAAVFFRGLGVCSVRAFVVNAAQWAVYEQIMKEVAPAQTLNESKEDIYTI
jgi:solute carrier family 25 (mitochondrial carnitine/acylcarnitine transporter), member 20/29